MKLSPVKDAEIACVVGFYLIGLSVLMIVVNVPDWVSSWFFIVGAFIALTGGAVLIVLAIARRR